MTAPLLLAAISAVILLQLSIGVGFIFWRLRHHGSAQPPVDSDASLRWEQISVYKVATVTF